MQGQMVRFSKPLDPSQFEFLFIGTFLLDMVWKKLIEQNMYGMYVNDI